MTNSFSPDFFVGNRNKLRQLHKSNEPIILTANGALQSGADMTFPFYQNRNFWYLTGIEEPDAILVIHKAQEYLLLSEDQPHRIRFESGKTANEVSRISGIKNVYEYKDGWQELQPLVKKSKKIATLIPPPGYIKYYGFYTNPAHASTIEKIKKLNPKSELLDIRHHFVNMRIVKQPVEVLAIKKAVEITEQALTEITNKTWNNRTTELDLSNEVQYMFKKYGANENAFDSIVASGKSTSVIHHSPEKIMLPKNGIIQIDVGASVNHYCADISRVYSVGKLTDRQLQVFDCVKDSLNQALNMLQPGLAHKEFELKMEKVVGQKLKKLDLIKTNTRKSVRKYFPTYTSHQLGLDPHDIHDPDVILKENMVLAVEPGIYIPEEGIGFRIEENVVIKNKGIEILSKNLPQDIASLKISIR